MQVIFGIDVSKTTSTVCELIGNGKNEFTITNDRPGFKRLIKELSMFTEHPRIIFEATGVYSRRLQVLFNDYGYQYVVMNPLKAKKEMDQGLRHNKTDKNDAYHLALIEKLNHHPVNEVQAKEYQQMQALSHFYDQLTKDMVSAKNRLHQALQSTFPEMEKLFSISSGQNYWQIVKHYPHCDTVRKNTSKAITDFLVKLKHYGLKRAQKTGDKLIKLANLTYPVVSEDSVETEQVRYYAQRLLALSQQRSDLITRMVKLAHQLPNHDLENLESIPGFAQTTAVRVLAELGDVRRFLNPNKIDAFIGIDPGRYQSGEMDRSECISKHGNATARKILYRAIGQIDEASKYMPCHIADYYESKKQSSQTKGFKKIAIASVHKLVRTIYALIIKDQPYDYSVAKSNIKTFAVTD